MGAVGRLPVLSDHRCSSCSMTAARREHGMGSQPRVRHTRAGADVVAAGVPISVAAGGRAPRAGGQASRASALGLPPPPAGPARPGFPSCTPRERYPADSSRMVVLRCLWEEGPLVARSTPPPDRRTRSIPLLRCAFGKNRNSEPGATVAAPEAGGCPWPVDGSHAVPTDGERCTSLTEQFALRPTGGATLAAHRPSSKPEEG